MPHGENALMDRDKRSIVDSPLNKAFPVAKRGQLPTRDHPMLPLGKRSDCLRRLKTNLATPCINFSTYFMVDLMRA